MPTTLVTGANGFVGATIVDTLLSSAHNHDKVILAVRRASAVDELLSTNPSWPKEKIGTFVISDITAPGAFDAAFKEFPEIDYVIHVAAPVFGKNNTDFVEHYEKPNVAGSRGLLASAKQHGKNVKAVSITGSINAITMGNQDDINFRTLSSSEWLPLSRDDAIREQNQFVSYCVGKKVAEEAVWAFVKEEQPAFSVTNFCPALIFGPMLQKVPSAQALNFSSGVVYGIMTSADSPDGDGKVPSTMFPAYIDVRDLAHFQIAALTTPAAANRRFILGHPIFFNDVATALRKSPDEVVAGRVGADNADPESMLLPKLDTGDVREVFSGFTFRSLAETVGDAARSILEVERAGKGEVNRKPGSG